MKQPTNIINQIGINFMTKYKEVEINITNNNVEKNQIIKNQIKQLIDLAQQQNKDEAIKILQQAKDLSKKLDYESKDKAIVTINRDATNTAFFESIPQIREKLEIVYINLLRLSPSEVSKNSQPCQNQYQYCSKDNRSCRRA